MKNTAESTLSPTDNPVLSVNELHGLLTEKNEQIKTLSSKLCWFEEQFKLLKCKHYAKSSEKQANLFDEDDTTVPEETEQETISYTRNKLKRNDKRLDTSQLPRDINTIDLSDEEKVCSCGHCLTQFGEERKEELVFKPANLKVIEHVRLKYSCRHCDTVKTPPAVELPLSKSKAGSALLAEVILNKYRYHLPLYRQSKLFSSLQLPMPDNTLGGWVMQAAERLAPLGEALWQQLSAVTVLQVDETPVKLLKPEKKAYMWLYHSYLPGKRFVIFDFNMSRAQPLLWISVLSTLKGCFRAMVTPVITHNVNALM